MNLLHYDAGYNFIQQIPESVGGIGGYSDFVFQSDTDGGFAGASFKLSYSESVIASRIQVGHCLVGFESGRQVYAGQVVAPDSDDFGTSIRVYYDPATGGAGFVSRTSTQVDGVSTAIDKHGTLWAPSIDISGVTGSTLADATQIADTYLAAEQVDGVATPPGAAEDTGEGYEITLNGVVREWAKRQPADVSWGAGKLSDAMVALVGTYGPGSLLSTSTAYITNPTAYTAAAHAFSKQSTLDIINTYMAYEDYEWGGFIPQPGFTLHEKTHLYCTSVERSLIHYVVDVSTLAEPYQGGTELVLDSGTNVRGIARSMRHLWIQPGVNIMLTGTQWVPRTLSGNDNKNIIHIYSVRVDGDRVTLNGNKRAYNPAVMLARLNNAA